MAALQKSETGLKIATKNSLSALAGRRGVLYPDTAGPGKVIYGRPDKCSRGDMKVLVIEDNEPFALLLCAALREAGYEADSALNGLVGIKTALAWRPELILLDYHLGDMSGRDVALYLERMQATAAIPFLLLSSMAGDPLVDGAFTRIPGCRGALSKTRPVPEIIAAVGRALAR